MKLKEILTNKVFWIIFGIMLVGAFLRAYHFSDWMHYQLDQARDFRIIHAAMQYGPGELPLQGPRAAGTFLRLGPLLYYLEYGSALVFGDTPSGSVVVILLLNILAIPLFYFFLRRFFVWKLAAGLTGIFAVSLFLIVYSRFGWNPTLIPFFMVLFGYALLRSDGRVDKHAGWWLVLAAAALAFAVNMHFVALVTVPLIAIVYFLWVRPRTSLRYWILAIAVFLFLNIPLIVNDIKTGGDNLNAFFEVAFAHSVDQEDGSRNIVDKVVKNIGLQTQYYWLTLTGDQFAGLPELKGNDVQCNYDCRTGFARGVIAFLLLFAGIGSWFWLYRTEKDNDKKDFLRLTAVWALVLFAVYTPLAFDMAPRFFLLTAPLAFVFLGFVPQAISGEHKKSGKIFAIIVIALCIIANLFFVERYFTELAHANDENFALSYSDRILKEKTRVTFAQMMAITDWMVQKYYQNGYPLFVHAQPEYKRAFWERIDTRGIPRSYIPSDLDKLYKEGNYFVIIRTQSDQEAFMDKYFAKMDLIEKKNFGTLTAYYLQPKEMFITAERKEFKPKSRDPRFAKGVQVRYLWRQVFDGCTYKSGECKKQDEENK